MSAQQILNWLESLPVINIYIVVFLSAFTENVFPPWPGDTVTVLCGFLISQGKGNFLVCFSLILLANVLTAILLYFAGESIIRFFTYLHTRWANSWLNSFMKPLVDPQQLAKTKIWFERWGILFIFLSRFFAGIRFFVSIIAGIVHMNIYLFLIVFSLGVILWNGLLLWGGWKLGENWHNIITFISLYNWFIFSLIFILLAAWLLWKWKFRKDLGHLS